MKTRLNNVRLAFPQLWEPKTVNGEGEPAFSATFLLAPDHPDVAKLRAAMEQIGKDKWGAKWPTVKKEIEAKDRTALHDGDTKSDYAGFAGNLFVSSRSKTRPGTFGADRNPVAEADGKLYAGCYVNAVVELWAQDNNFGRRINASLSGVQFLKDGDAFAGGVAAKADDFEDVSSGAMAEDLV